MLSKHLLQTNSVESDFRLHIEATYQFQLRWIFLIDLAYLFKQRDCKDDLKCMDYKKKLTALPIKVGFT